MARSPECPNRCESATVVSNTSRSQRNGRYLTMSSPPPGSKIMVTAFCKGMPFPTLMVFDDLNVWHEFIRRVKKGTMMGL